MNKPIIYIAESLCESVKNSLLKAIDEVNKAKDMQIRCEMLKNVPGCKEYYWCRDYMPVLISDDGKYATFKFDPDYLREYKTYVKCIIPQDKVCADLEFDRHVDLGITFDGGNYVRCGDKVVMTDKIFVENPQWRAADLLAHLEEKLQAEVVLLPWDMAEFCGHSDGMVAYLGDGQVLLNGCWENRDKKFHSRLLKILKGRFGEDKVKVLSLGREFENKPTWCYLNYLKLPGAILLPRLAADDADENDKLRACDNAAVKAFEKLFPNDEIEIKQVYAMPLVKKGGALHCVTWELVGED